MTVLLDIVGLCLIVAGAWLIVPWLAFIVAGCACLGGAFVLDQRGKPARVPRESGRRITDERML